MNKNKKPQIKKINYCLSDKNIATPALIQTLCGLSEGNSTNKI